MENGEGRGERRMNKYSLIFAVTGKISKGVESSVVSLNG